MLVTKEKATEVVVNEISKLLGSFFAKHSLPLDLPREVSIVVEGGIHVTATCMTGPLEIRFEGYPDDTISWCITFRVASDLKGERFVYSDDGEYAGIPEDTFVDILRAQIEGDKIKELKATRQAREWVDARGDEFDRAMVVEFSTDFVQCGNTK